MVSGSFLQQGVPMNFYPINGAPNYTADSRDVWYGISLYLKSESRKDLKDLIEKYRSILASMNKNRDEIQILVNELEYKVQLLISKSGTEAYKCEWLRFLGSFQCEQTGWWKAGVISLVEHLKNSYHSEYSYFHKKSPFFGHMIFYTTDGGENICNLSPQFYFPFLKAASKLEKDIKRGKPYAFVVLKKDTRRYRIYKL
jgi:hypothetical protein